MAQNIKLSKLRKLAEQRKADSLPPHFSLRDFHNGFYECNYVSPWTLSAKNSNASLMLIGQDWSSSDHLAGPKNEKRRRLGQEPNLPTNVNLKRLLRDHMKIEFAQTYATNLFPFIKAGGISAPIPKKDLLYCAKQYAIPQIKIIRPRMVICLGAATFNAVRKALGEPNIRWEQAKLPNKHTILVGTEIYGAPHPGARGIQNAGGMDNVNVLWNSLANRLRKLTQI